MTSDPICWYSIHQPLRHLLQCRRDTEMGQVRRCGSRPPTVRFYFNCRHHTALPRTTGLCQNRYFPLLIDHKVL